MSAGFNEIDDEYDVYCRFDIEKHKKRYANYLEVIIREDGEIVYAVPSHQQKAAEIACEKLNVTREELESRCPQEYYFDYLNWLLMQSNSVAVWTDFCVVPAFNRKHIAAIRKMKLAGIYKEAYQK